MARNTPAKRPNLLLIVADQHRADCIGAAGEYPARTPRLDRLAADGALFRRAFTTTPVCVPARQAMLSGRTADSCGSFWNPKFLPTRVLQPDPAYWTPALARAGYNCAHFGKWGLEPGHSAQDFGFATSCGLDAHRQLIRERYPNLRYTNGWFGEPSPIALEDSATHWLARRAAAHLQARAATAEPWFIRIDFSEPHLPCRPSEPFASAFAHVDLPPWPSFGDPLTDKPYIQRQQVVNWNLEQRTWADWRHTVAMYLATIAQIDDAVGLVLDALAASGAADDTIVLYTSDHGDLCGGHGMLDKHYVLYDDVTRVPLIVRAPGRVAPGSRPEAFVSGTLDLAATVADWCGLADVDSGQGHSWAPLLAAGSAAGELEQPWDCAVFSGNGQQFGLFSSRGIRTADWLYVWNLCDTDELYSVADDPGQKHNRIRDPRLAEPLAALRRRLHAELIRRQDPLLGGGWVDDQLLLGRKL